MSRDKDLYKLGQGFVQVGTRICTFLYELGQGFVRVGTRIYTSWDKDLYELGQGFVHFYMSCLSQRLSHACLSMNVSVL